MNAFTFQRAAAAQDAARTVGGHPGAVFLAGGTTLVDLMKVDVLRPRRGSTCTARVWTEQNHRKSHGPEKKFFDKVWTVGDVEEVKP